MAHRILPPAVERFEIHDAVCRDRRQNLSCSTCSDLYELAVRAYRAPRYGACSCGVDDYLIAGLCEPCRMNEAA